MNCREWEERIALYAGGDLAAEEATEVERHVAGCPGCRTLLSGLGESLQWLWESHAQPVEAAHFAAVRARVLAEIGHSRRPWWRQAWVYGGAVAAALAVWMVAHPGTKPQPPVAGVVKTEPVKAAVAALEPGPAPPLAPVSTPRPHRRVRPPNPPSKAAETVLVKLETNDPDVVIYWIAETKGEPK